MPRPVERGLPPGETATTSSNPNLSLRITTSQPTFTAGQTITGYLELVVNKLDVYLADVGIQCSGFEGEPSFVQHNNEQTTVRPHSLARGQRHRLLTSHHYMAARQTELKSQSFTSTKRILSAHKAFQGPALPPSNAVNARAPPSGDYSLAFSGATRFPFAFHLAESTPSSCSLGKNATRRFELRATAAFKHRGIENIISTSEQVTVVEQWEDWNKKLFQEGSERNNSQSVKTGDGRIAVAASLQGVEQGGDGILFWREDKNESWMGKSTIKVGVKVRNGSKRSVSRFSRIVSNMIARLTSTCEHLDLWPQNLSLPQTPDYRYSSGV